MSSTSEGRSGMSRRMLPIDFVGGGDLLADIPAREPRPWSACPRISAGTPRPSVVRGGCAGTPSARARSLRLQLAAVGQQISSAAGAPFFTWSASAQQRVHGAGDHAERRLEVAARVLDALADLLFLLGLEQLPLARRALDTRGPGRCLRARHRGRNFLFALPRPRRRHPPQAVPRLPRLRGAGPRTPPDRLRRRAGAAAGPRLHARLFAGHRPNSWARWRQSRTWALRSRLRPVDDESASSRGRPRRGTGFGGHAGGRLFRAILQGIASRLPWNVICSPPIGGRQLLP